MKKIFFLTAISLFLMLATSGCDKDDNKAPGGDIVVANMDFVAQFEMSMNEYIDISVSWFDDLGLYHSLSPSQNPSTNGNRYFSNVNAQIEYLKFPAEFCATISYKLREGVELPEEGLDIIVFSSLIVDSTYENGVEQKTTKDGFSYTRLKVMPDEIAAEIDYLNEVYSLAYVTITADGEITFQ